MCHHKQLLITPILLFLFTFLTPLFIFGGVNDSIKSEKVQNTVIYVSDGAVMHGINLISNAIVIQTSELNADANKKLEDQKKNVIVSKQIVSKKTVQDQSLKILQDKIDKIIEIFYSSSPEEHLSKLQKSKMSVSAAVNYSPHLFASDIYLINFYQLQISKQKIDFSLSFLEYSKLLDSFLRGPPAFFQFI